MPIARYLDWLRRSKNEESYMQKLVNAFNSATIDGLMCRNLISVDWLGNLYDCDFNQMLDLQVESKQTVFNFDFEALKNRRIITENHCFGCTAGSGSSCGGTVT
jgi:radical SAM/Cys-rich protein